MRDGIFVSYSHADRAWLGELQRVFESLPGAVRVDVWDDTRLVPGSRWQGEIKEALDTAAAAVLLLSPAFFRSEFIAARGLPEVLAAAARGELVILPLVVEPCAHAAVTATYQSVHDPAAPLEALDEAGRQRVWQRLLASLNDVAASIGQEAHIGAEMLRLRNDVEAGAEVAHVLDKIARASVDPAFEGNDAMRENTLVFLEGQRCQAIANAAHGGDEAERPHAVPEPGRGAHARAGRPRAGVALRRATELTQQFADQALAMLQAAKGSGGGAG